MFEKGIKCFTLGPGGPSGGGSHGTNECIDIQEVLDAAKAYAMFAVDWCGAE
jgi:acetylornithine deacetylase/succinyl-diaminopimelate desuccinylase-like protein